MSKKPIARKRRSRTMRALKVAGIAELMILGSLSAGDVASADGMPPDWPDENAQNQDTQTAPQSLESQDGSTEGGAAAGQGHFDELEALIAKQQKQLELQQREISELQDALTELQISLSQVDGKVAQAGEPAKTLTESIARAENGKTVPTPRRRGIEEPDEEPATSSSTPFGSAAVASNEALQEERGTGSPSATNQSAPPSPTPKPTSAPPATQVAESGTPNDNREQVGERPPEEKKRPPELPAIADIGGVLTPPGILTVEAGLTLSHTSTSRFLFRGVEILPSFLIGVIEVTEADREYAGLSVGGRYGITDRIEGSLSIPFAARADDITTSGASLGANNDQRDVSGYGLGDIEAGVQYQINQGKDDWPVMVGNLKVKIPTGQGPFDIERDPQNGLERELPTGSGFWGIQPSITFIKSMDPLVFYGNLNYVLNLPRDINEEISTSNGVARIEDVDPGDAIGVSFGGALAITENVSMSLGYEHYYVMGTEQTASTFIPLSPPPPLPPLGSYGPPVTTKGQDAQVGSLLFGVNFREDDGGSYSVTLSAGLTDDAPDVQFAFRRPFSFDIGRIWSDSE